MAHFCKLSDENIVLTVEVVNNDIATDEQAGVDFLNKLYGTDDNWKQTSYNSSFRKNFAGIGYTYDESRDAFLLPKPYPSWALNETTCKWEPPTSYPDDNTKPYLWDESNLTWTPVS
tara:strand:- start:981 stop:1331 length:351 start_codon:yes stop_codon:yes gene_type:complete